jgi:hypothetical protein
MRNEPVMLQTLKKRKKMEFFDMSKFNKCALVGAIAMAVSGAAYADGTVVATNASYAHEVNGGTTATLPTAIATSVSYDVQAPDILIGRSSVTGQVTVSGTITGAKLAAAPAVSFPTPGAGAAASLQGSVTSGTNSFQFVVLPPDVAAGGFAAGNIFTISSLSLNTADALETLGGQVTVTIEVRDTTTGTLLSSATAKPVLTAVQASAISFSAPGSTTIDVMDPSFKTQFVGSSTVATLGTVTVGQADVDAVTGGLQVASTAGTAATTNNNAGSFVFDTAADEIVLTLNVPKADAFESLYAVATGTACAAVVPAGAEEFEQVGTGAEWTATVPVLATTGATYNICAVATGDDKIDAQTIGLTAKIDLAGANTIDPPAKTIADFHTLKYNGTVVDVDHFNPAANTAQISYLRIINPSSAAGLVTIEGVCDNGDEQAGVSVNLAAGNAILLTSADLAEGKKGLSGNFEQCAAGKSRLTVTGEFAGMTVQNFLRNVTADGTQINTNVNNQD